MWTVSIDGDAGYFPLYPTRERARRVANSFRSYWVKHVYRVVRVYE